NIGLNKLVAFLDDNNISIDGDTKGWFSDNTPERFREYGWHVIENVDGHEFVAIEKAINEAHSQHQKQNLICCKTVI
ncbi:transketolase, partial [Francisella tularensis subsp. holarctica]|nr:transketolase [Francisella tularensis subsp. holarctica]